MTHHNDEPEDTISRATVAFGGRPLETIIRDEQRSLVDAVLGGLVADLPTYGSLPPEELLGDITAAIERGLRVYLDVLGSGRPPDREALDEIGESAARRAEEGISLANVLDAYLLGVRVTLVEVAREAQPGDEQSLLTAMTRALSFLEASTAVVVTRYLDEHQLMSDVRIDAERQVLAALLRGGTIDALDRLESIEIAPAYAVVRVAVGAHRDELRPGVDASIAAHRKVRRIRAELHRSVGGAISSITPSGGTILLPRSDGRVSGHEPSVVATDLVTRLGVAADADVWAAVVEASADAVPDAAVQAEEVLELVRRLDRDPGTYGLADVLLEFQLTRPGPARTALAATLAPLDGHPQLLATLRTYLATGGNRRRTALDLRVHPNTVDYRIRRIASLTRVDPTGSAGAFQLSAALLALDSESRPPLDPRGISGQTSSR